MDLWLLGVLMEGHKSKGESKILKKLELQVQDPPPAVQLEARAWAGLM